MPEQDVLRNKHDNDHGEQRPPEERSHGVEGASGVSSVGGPGQIISGYNGASWVRSLPGEATERKDDRKGLRGAPNFPGVASQVTGGVQ